MLLLFFILYIYNKSSLIWNKIKVSKNSDLIFYIINWKKYIYSICIQTVIFVTYKKDF